MSASVLQFNPAALAELRAQRKLSLAAIGDQIGRDRVAVWRFERGRREPTLATIGHIADALGVEFTTLIERVEVGE